MFSYSVNRKFNILKNLLLCEIRSKEILTRIQLEIV